MKEKIILDKRDIDYIPLSMPLRKAFKFFPLICINSILNKFILELVSAIFWNKPPKEIFAFDTRHKQFTTFSAIHEKKTPFLACFFSNKTKEVFELFIFLRS